MRSEFDCSSYNERECSIHNHAFYLGEQYQQSKVDELQNNINLLKEALDIKEQLNQKLREREDELQKRVDASLIAFENLKEEINELHGQCDLHLIKYLEEKSQVLEQALKGGFDASN